MEKLEQEQPIEKKFEETQVQAVEKAPELPNEQAEDLQLPKITGDDDAVSDQDINADEELVIIKSILSENIFQIYNELPVGKKKAFQKKGEETALKVRVLLKNAKVRASDIFELIKNWLKMLPGANVYFLEQEAKIKTDKVLELKKKGQKVEW